MNNNSADGVHVADNINQTFELDNVIHEDK